MNDSQVFGSYEIKVSISPDKIAVLQKFVNRIPRAKVARSICGDTTLQYTIYSVVNNLQQILFASQKLISGE